MKSKKWIWIVAEILIIWIFLSNVGISYITGDSMLPVLESGDVIIYVHLGSVESGDIVVFKSDSLDKLLVKRIEQVEDGQCFVLGDNRSNSLDSRNPLIGWISEDAIKGKAVFRILPLEKWGGLGEQ